MSLLVQVATALRRHQARADVGLAAGQEDDGNLAVGLALVVVVGGPNVGHQRPQARSLLASGSARDNRYLIALDLDRCGGIGPKILVPRWVVRRPALRRDDHPAIAVGAMDQRCSARLSGGAPGGRQQQDRRAAPVVSAFASRLAIHAHMLGPEQLVVGGHHRPESSEREGTTILLP